MKIIPTKFLLKFTLEKCSKEQDVKNVCLPPSFLNFLSIVFEK